MQSERPDPLLKKEIKLGKVSYLFALLLEIRVDYGL